MHPAGGDRCRSPLGVDGHIFDFEHLGDGSDTGDGFFGKLTDAVRKGAEELIADVDRAAAHAGDNARVFRLGAVELGKDHILPGTACSAQYTKNFNLHRLGLGSGKDGPGGGHLAAMNLAKGEKAAAGGWGAGGRRAVWPEMDAVKKAANKGAASVLARVRIGVRDCLKAGIHVYKIKPALHCSGRMRPNFVCHALRF